MCLFFSDLLLFVVELSLDLLNWNIRSYWVCLIFVKCFDWDWMILVFFVDVWLNVEYRFFVECKVNKKGDFSFE